MGGGGETVTLTEFLRFCDGHSPKSGGTVGSCRRLWFTNWGRSELRSNLWGSKLGWHLGKEAVRFRGGNGDSAVTSAGLCPPTSGLGHVQCSALRLLLWLVLRLLKRLSASSSASSRIGTGLNKVQFCEGSIWGEIWKNTRTTNQFDGKMMRPTYSLQCGNFRVFCCLWDFTWNQLWRI